MRTCAFFLMWTMLALVPSAAQALSIAGFGDSITCDTCNDGSYLGLLDDHLGFAPVIFDNGLSADISDDVLSRLDLWLDTNSADIVIVLTGTPDVYKDEDGFHGVDYSEALTVSNAGAMIDMIKATSASAMLVAPPPVVSPCGDPSPLDCSTIDARLASLAVEYAALAVSKMVPFVNLYDIFSVDPTPIADLLRGDGLHPKLATGDDLIAASIKSVLVDDMLVPEPSTGLLLAMGLCVLAVRRKRLRV